jgi:hypothetical protein
VNLDVREPIAKCGIVKLHVVTDLGNIYSFGYGNFLSKEVKYLGCLAKSPVTFRV